MVNTINKALPLIFRVFALVAAALGLVGAIVILIFGGSPDAPRAMFILALVLGFFYFVFFWTVAYVINLLEGIADK